MAQPQPATPRSSRSARVKAQRPQLAPIVSVRTAQAMGDDPDVAQVQERTPDVREWQFGAGQAPASVLKPAPEPTSAPTPTPQLTLTPCTIHDIDQLWDWCREDVKGTSAFLGFAPGHSRALQDYIGKLLALEAKGLAWLRTVMVDGHALGLVSMLPVHRDAAEPYGDAHCYLMPALQGHLAELLPGILAEASRQEPSLTFRVFTPDYAFARLLQPHGFTLNIVLTRPASVGQQR